MLTLNVEKRDSKLSPENIRKTGKIPAVFYGPKEKSTPVVIDAKAFQKIWKQAGESSVIILKDGSHEHEALIHETDIHPISGAVRHADFYVIEKGKKVSVKVQLVFSGVSSAVKDKGGILAEYGLSEEQGNEIIMAARAHWFEDEDGAQTEEAADAGPSE